MSVYVSMPVIFLGFLSIRFFGQGMMTMTSRVMMSKWFERRRGLAVGISGLFISPGFNIAPLGLNYLIDRFGWSGAYCVLAIGVSCGTGLVGWLFYRDRPEDFGLVRDGRVRDAVAKKSAKPDVRVREFTLQETRRTYSFWVFCAGLSCNALTITAFTFHIVSLSETAGLIKEQGLALLIPIAFISVATNLTAGWLSDKTKLKYLLMADMGALAVGCLGLLWLGTGWGQCILIGGYGVAFGLFSTLMGVTWPRFFGVRHLGAIGGLSMAVVVFASAVGPFIFGSSFQWVGSYTPGLLIAVTLAAIVFAAAFRADNPQEQQA